MSDNMIVIRAEDDSVISVLMEYITTQKKALIQRMGNSLLSGEDRDAAVAAASLHQLDVIVDVLKEAIEEQTKGNGDNESDDPARWAH